MTPDEYLRMEEMAKEIKRIYGNHVCLLSPSWRPKDKHEKSWKKAAMVVMENEWDPERFVATLFRYITPYPMPTGLSTTRAISIMRTDLSMRPEVRKDHIPWVARTKIELDYINSRLVLYGEQAFKFIKTDEDRLSPIAMIICHLADDSLNWGDEVRDNAQTMWEVLDVRESYQTIFGGAGFEKYLKVINQMFGKKTNRAH